MIVEEFRKFIARGNVVDLAVGLVIGAAFATVVGSFVEDVLMPPIGLALGGVDFSNLFITLSGGPYPTLGEAREAGAATINYGLFINNVITFVIVAFAVYLVVRAYNRMRMPEVVAPTAAACPFCQIPIPLAATRCGHCTSQLPAR
jgi:large conductance mechanosensitive channel